MPFKSLLSRIVLLHVLVVTVAAIVLPLILFWLLTSEIDQLQRSSLRGQAEALADRLVVAADGRVGLDLLESQKDLYSEAYGRYGYDVVDEAGRILFSSRKSGAAIGGSPSSSSITGASVGRSIGGRQLTIRVAEDLAHRDVITDDIAANFFRRVGWTTIPTLLVVLAIDILIFRRAVAPLLRASEDARQIGPSRTEIRLPVVDLPTEIVPLVTAVNQALDRLESGFRLQRQFTADAAHQLRTPLAVLRSRIETLGNRAGTAELIADIAGMSRIVSQLLEIAELDTLVVDPTETAELRGVCADVVGAIAPFALAQGKEIALKGAEQPVIIRGNAELLQRAIFNLAENAIKYTAARTLVEVELGDDGSVSVRDCGPGIRPAERDLIFQRFWRGDHRHTDGAGLGLSIVRAVVDDHAGTVEVDNRPDGGAQFTLRFRLADPPGTAP